MSLGGSSSSSISENRGGAKVVTTGTEMEEEEATVEIGMKVGAAVNEAETEGVMALLFWNEGTEALDLLVDPLTKPRKKLERKKSANGTDIDERTTMSMVGKRLPVEGRDGLISERNSISHVSSPYEEGSV